MNTCCQNVARRMIIEQDVRLAAIADNLANLATPGYRKTRVLTRSFDQVFEQHAGLPVRIMADTTDGPLRQTDAPLDVAIRGRGFFVVEKDGRFFLTRNGQFALSPERQLVTMAGYVVQGEGGPLTLPPDRDPSSLTVDGDGTLRSNGQTIGRLRLLDTEHPESLARAGTTLFAVPPDAKPAEAGSYHVMNRAVEGSNASAFEEIAEMMNSLRAYELCQKVLRAEDTTQSNMIRSSTASA